MPKRIQRKRTKGWKMPENTIYVGRPTKWGNPFVVGKVFQTSPLLAVLISNGINDLYRQLIDGLLIKDANQAVELYGKLAKIFGRKKFIELKGKDLACWCPLDTCCHADVLLKLANK